MSYCAYCRLNASSEDVPPAKSGHLSLLSGSHILCDFCFDCEKLDLLMGDQEVLAELCGAYGPSNIHS